MQLVINTGSTSKKYAFYNGEDFLLAARFEEVGNAFAYTLTTKETGSQTSSVDEVTYKNALETFLEVLSERGHAPRVVGVRVVSPGTYFTEHRLIDEEYLTRLEITKPYAPLHVTPALSEIKRIKSALPRIKAIAVSDSAFHTTIPESNRRYSIKGNDTEELDIYRFGYHGLSVASVMRMLPEVLLESDARRTIVCHVGGGVSVTALYNGESHDTSMGFSPASGLHMGTRTGDIDPSALIYLAERRNLTYKELRTYLNTEGGLKGVYGHADLREVLKGREQRDTQAQLAVEMFVSRIKKHIGAGVALIGGLDTLVLTATAVERNPVVRRLITKDLQHLGVVLDDEKNEHGNENENRAIEKEGSPVTIAVVHTDEMGEIARIASEWM